jgi:hypothetical protein
MIGPAGVRLFQIIVEPNVGAVEGWRHPAGRAYYRLSVSATDWLMTPTTAARLGRAAKRLLRALSKPGVSNFRVADDAEPEIRTGAMFTGRSQDGKLMVELGTADREAILVQIGNAKLRLAGDQAASLLEAFARFDDVSIPVGAVRHTQLAIAGEQMFESWDWWR